MSSAPSAAISRIQIGKHIWKIGGIIKSIRTNIIEKRKMIKTFGTYHETGRGQGAFFG
jgi:hypothetical protein